MAHSDQASDTENRLLERVLCALDDLYDRRDQSEQDLGRLLLATSEALRGTNWERALSEAASALDGLMRAELDYNELNKRALIVTGDLRLRIAAEL